MEKQSDKLQDPSNTGKETDSGSGNEHGLELLHLQAPGPSTSRKKFKGDTPGHYKSESKSVPTFMGVGTGKGIQVDMEGRKKVGKAKPSKTQSLKSRSIQGNVRRSSLTETGIDETMRSQFSASIKSRHAAGEERIAVPGKLAGHSKTSEAATQWEDPEEESLNSAEDQHVGGRRRHSTGSASAVNGANLRALIRRFQQRRFKPPTRSSTVKYIQYFMACLYYIGMSPIQPESAKKYHKFFHWFQWIMFWIFVTTSIFQSVCDAKYEWIQFRVKENMSTFVTFGFWFANGLIRIYHVKLFATASDATTALYQKIDKINSKEAPDGCGWAKLVAVTFATFAISLSALNTILAEVPLNDWSIKEAIFLRSYELGEYLFIWTSDNYTDESVKLYYEYGLTLNKKVALSAGIGAWFNFFGTLHSCIMVDIWPIIAIQIYILQCHFTNSMESTKKMDLEGRCPLSINWMQYKELQAACDETHKVFGQLLKLNHLQNILMYTDFLLQILKKQPITGVTLYKMVSIIKVSLTYYMVQMSADKNEKYAECVIECAGMQNKIEMDGHEVSVSMLLKEMKKRPIGVGRGEFYVNEAFMLKFVATVGSIFILVSDDTVQKCICGMT